MKSKTIYFQLSFIFLFVFAKAQKQQDNWYFGSSCAVSFVSGTPVPITTSAMSANEGAASISDSLGNLLFYTNGMSVWNKNNVIMPNGTNLSSDIYTGQPAVIIKQPGSTNLYYVFTMNTWEFATTNLKYSIVDISLNGGFGNVTSTKNILVNNNVREQLTAVQHANGQDYWIVVHEGLSTKFLAYKLTSSGLDLTPVTSSVGMTYSGANRFGCLKFSHDCTKLVSILGSTSSVNETVQLYDFDNLTGTISNTLTVATYADIPGAYSCEFSPDNGKLYVASYNQPKIFQYDLNAVNIAATQIDISNGIPGTKCGLNLARDGKIYVAMVGTPYLSVINSPNNLGLNCNFQSNVINLGSGHTCRLALPNNYSIICGKTSGIDDVMSTNGNLKIYPNPSNGLLNFEISNVADHSEVMLINSTGKKVFSFDIGNGQMFTRNITIDLAKGIYIVVVNNENTSLSKKIIIQ